jgi:hypothetical protein
MMESFEGENLVEVAGYDPHYRMGYNIHSPVDL